MEANEIFEQAKRDGFANIYTDTPDELIERLRRYNEEMGVCRVNRKKAKNCELAFQIINPIFAVVLCMISMLSTEHVAVSAVTTLVFLAIYFVFTVLLPKKNMLVVSAASAILLLVGTGSIVLLLLDLGIAVFHMNIESELKTHDGYSAFNDIRLIYSEQKTPVGKTEGE